MIKNIQSCNTECITELLLERQGSQLRNSAGHRGNCCDAVKRLKIHFWEILQRELKEESSGAHSGDSCLLNSFGTLFLVH